MTSAAAILYTVFTGRPNPPAVLAADPNRADGSHTCHFALGRSFSAAWIWLVSVGDVTVSVRTRSPSPFFSAAFSRADVSAAWNPTQLAIRVLLITVFERSGSYIVSSDA